MAGFAILALLGGAAASLCLTVFQFLLGVLATLVAVMVMAKLRETGLDRALLWAAALTAAAQVGFVLGLAAQAADGPRRRS